MVVRVLLADDDELLLRALADSLQGPGLAVVATSSTADEAVERACLVKPDVAIVDFSMPGGGTDLVRRLCGLTRPPRVLVFSGRDDADTVLDVLAAGASAFVAKIHGAPDMGACAQRCADGGFFVLGRSADEVRRRLLLGSTAAAS